MTLHEDDLYWMNISIIENIHIYICFNKNTNNNKRIVVGSGHGHCPKKYFILTVKFAIRQKSWILREKKHSNASLSNPLFVNQGEYQDKMNK